MPNDKKSPLLSNYINIFLSNKNIMTSNTENKVLLYRGQSNKEYQLLPSVFRDNLLQNESHIIKELILHAPEEFININNLYERLIKMQHYGLPTRLLDFTFNPLVALYFACQKSSKTTADNDGEIIVNFDIVHQPDEEIVKWFALLSEYNGKSAKDLNKFYESNNLINNYSIERELEKIRSRISEVKSNRPYIDISMYDNLEKMKNDQKIIDILKGKYISVLSPRNNERIKRQQGALILIGIDLDKTMNKYSKESFDIKDIIDNGGKDGIKRSIIIPAKDKEKLLFELDAIGINKAFLFPELEHQADYIKSKYI